MADTILNKQYRLEEFFGAPPSSDAVEAAGSFARDIEKGPRTQVGGSRFWHGDGTGKLAQRTEGSGNGGADIVNSITDSKSEGGVQFQSKAARYWFIWRMHRDAFRLVQGQPDASADKNLSDTLRNLYFTQRNWWKSFSNYGWRTGRGGCARLAANAAVGTNIVRLARREMARAFERGDVLVGYDPATYNPTQPGVLATPRAGTVTVTQINRSTGDLTLSAVYNVGITGGAAGDIIGHRDYRQPAADPDNFTASLYGVGTYLSFSLADQSLTALGVNRANDTERTAGRYRQLSAGTPFRAVVDEILEVADAEGLPIDRIYCPTRAYKDIMRDFQNSQRRSVSDTMVMNQMRYGVRGAVFEGSMGEGIITTDRYLWDERSDADIYVATVSSDWGYATTEQGVSWAREGAVENAGGYFTKTEAGQLQADYGGVGNLLCANTGRQIVIRVGAEPA